MSFSNSFRQQGKENVPCFVGGDSYVARHVDTGLYSRGADGIYCYDKKKRTSTVRGFWREIPGLSEGGSALEIAALEVLLQSAF